MDASGSQSSNRDYYDAFTQHYEDQRGDHAPGGYHDLLDELEADFVERYGSGGDVLEAIRPLGVGDTFVGGYAHADALDRLAARALDGSLDDATLLELDDQL